MKEQAKETPRLIFLDEVDSTNNWAKAHLAELGHLDAVCAASQTAGKGRLGRGWANAGEEGLYYTIACKAPLRDPASLPLLASLAAAGAVRDLFGLDCQIPQPVPQKDQGLRVRLPLEDAAQRPGRAVAVRRDDDLLHGDPSSLLCRIKTPL